MSSYNLIPFTDLTATGFTNAVVTTSFTVNSFTVADATGADANQFVALGGTGTTEVPPYTFASDTRAGMFADSANSGIGFSMQGQKLGLMRGFTTNGTTFLLIGSTSMGTEGGSPNFSFKTLAGGQTTVQVTVGNLVGRFVGQNTLWGMTDANTLRQFSGLGSDSIAVLVIASFASPTAIGTLWATVTTLGWGPGHCFTKPGLLQQATTTVVPSTVRSLAHVTNLLTGAASLFVTLPTSAPGLKYTVSNAQATAQTVVVNPVAADTLNVFGLTKAAGASVAANAPFSSITFHCITSTVWLATKKTGTWT